MCIYVVASNACLSAVHEFSNYNPPSGSPYISCCVNHNWTFTTQLQNTGDKVFGSLRGNICSGSCGASEQYDIDLGRDECFGHLDLPLDTPIKSLIEIYIEQFLQDSRCMWRHLTRFQDDTVSCCHGDSNKWQWRIEWVIPGRDNECDPQWLWLNVCLSQSNH